nr:MAG: major capsid protein [Microvirus sp.]
MKKQDLNPFNRVLVETPDRNTFDLSFDNKLTLDMGNLYPVLVQETLPGDNFHITPEMLIRFAPMTFPIMHRIDATIHFFYVPNRILWKNWTKFLAMEKVAGVPYSPLYIQGTTEEPLNVEVGSIYDYLGLPIDTNIKEKINAFPLLAFLKIYNEYYQDQNNDSYFQLFRDTLEAIYDKSGGRIAPSELMLDEHDYDQLDLLQRAWQHDYFTSALPFAQKGDAVNIPLELESLAGPVRVAQAFNFNTTDPAADGSLDIDSSFLSSSGSPFQAIELQGMATFDGSDAVLSGTINQLRAAMQLQKFLELNARSGTRYNELIRAHFGEDIGDARINRPEYIGGIKNNVMISEILQTSSTTESSALGEYAGNANAIVSGDTMHFSCPEHGFIIGILSVVPRTAYSQGINRKYTRQDALDYYWSHFAHIGEQAILNKELYYNSALSDNDGTFGYIPRYSEYKYNASEVHGDFRTNLEDFHLARKFSNRPNLSEEFIYVNPEEQKRIFAIQQEDVNSLYAHIYFDMQAQRKIPFFTNPGGL